MFLDQAAIKVIGGSGGRGCVSWRRESFVPKGGPDGGNGGNGGNVYLIADANTDTLSAYASKKVFKAEIGHYGMGKNCNGKGGEDLLLPVPPGTLIKDAATGAILADLPHPGDQVLIAGGGRGGYGNAHFKSSTRQRPDFAELGEPGEEKKIALELKLVADVGIIGLPSVGKSTLIAAISSARPKIADYPFTTLIPNLGVVSVDDRSYVVCDVPGLIGGASEGKGLGIQFLRHIERCGVLLHLLDVSRALGEGNVLDPQILLADYKTIRAELEAHSPTLSQKQELVLLNKHDLVASHTEDAVAALKEAGIDVFMSISAAAHSGTEELKKKLLPLVLSFRKAQLEPREETSLPVLRPGEQSDQMGAYRIEQQEDGSIFVRGKRLEQFVRMTNFESIGGVRRFKDVFERIGLLRAIRSVRKESEAAVYVAGIRIDEYL
ncbi:MAG: GTPase ObgE [Candidatus Peribacteraceae bacterium]|nr:GTPase ObgE [Candidatus Peribacteraceae bacterium]